MADEAYLPLKVEGVLASGLGRGAAFLTVDWVRNQIKHHTGIDPFPGTFNLRIPQQAWSSLFARRHSLVQIADPVSNSCPGYMLKISLRSQAGSKSGGYVILPELTVYQDVLEVVSAERLRDSLGVTDGDRILIEEISEG